MVFVLYAQGVLAFQEARADKVRIRDRVAEWLPIYDMSWVVEPLTLTTSAYTVGRMYADHGWVGVEELVVCFALVNLCKSFSLFLLPLDVPEGFLPMTDHVSQFVSNRTVAYTCDLFFSSHTALLVLCTIYMQSWWVAGITLLVALALMVNRVHYSIDIYAAPFFAYCCYSATRCWYGFYC